MDRLTSGETNGKIEKQTNILEGHNICQYQLLSVLSARLSPLNIDHSRNLPVEIPGVNYTETNTYL